jgi:hypothetical protein
MIKKKQLAETRTKERAMFTVLIDSLRLLSDHSNQTSRYFAIFAVQQAKEACAEEDVVELLSAKLVIEATQEITRVIDEYKAKLDAMVLAAEEVAAEVEEAARPTSW